MNQILKYNNLDLQNPKILKNIDWSRKENKNYSSMHSISSYLAMFCPALPSYFIDLYSDKNSIVMDNFSGRGTTALVCREKGRKFVGNDLNPYAYVLSKSKISNCNKKQLIRKVFELEKKFNSSLFKDKKIDYNDKKNKELSYFYSDETLRQLLFLREEYGKKWKYLNKYENTILAFALGLMHGPTKKDGSTIYFSLKMPNTISMAPNYVLNYSIKNNLIRPDVNIFHQLINRIKEKYDDDIFNKKYEGKIFFSDSTKKSKFIKNSSIDLVVTSPPYLSIVNYTRSNWLKLWLLGYDREELKTKIKLSDSLKFEEYIIFIKSYLNAIYTKLKNRAKVCLIVGDVFERKLIEEVWKKIKDEVNYKFVEIYYDKKYLQTHKITNMLNSKNGKATKIDKVLVLEKN